MLIIAAVILGMTGCPPEDKPPQPNPTEQLLQREKEQRMQLEASKSKETASKETWQALATVSVIAAVVLLITGIILGSKARNDAERHE
jgi:hypothetical protein